jgi:hypothetical protein
MTWDKTWPEGGAALNIGDNRLRDNMEHLEDALNREHSFPGSFGTNAGRHMLPIADEFADLATITGAVNGMVVGRSDIKIFYQRQSGVWVPMTAVIYDTAANRGTFPTADCVLGLIWWESDTGAMYMWDGSAWAQIGLRADWTELAEATAANQTGSTSRVDTTGVTVSILCPNDGIDYEIKVEAEGTYLADGSGVGFYLMEDAVDVDEKLAAPVSSGSMTLRYRNASPTPATTYVYKLQHAMSAGSTSSRINPTEGTLGIGALPGSSTSWSHIWATCKPRYKP